MYLYKITKENKLIDIKEISIKKEKDLQNLCELNIDQIFSLKFVKSEFTGENFRIDTLAYDVSNNSFVIIEYKKDKNFSVIDQGYAYLSLMLNHKADFILEYNENCKNTIKRNDIDWSQSKVIFVSPVFTGYQKQSINFKDLPIELWEVKQFDNETIYFTPIRPVGAVESIKTISKESDTIKQVSNEIKIYSEDELLINTNEDIKDLYFKLKETILNLDNQIVFKPTKIYLAFILNKTNIVDIAAQKKSLKIWLNLSKGELLDPENLLRDVSSIGHHGNGDYEIQIENEENFDYLVSLIRQTINKKNK